MTASFQVFEEGLSHSVPMPPDAPPPEARLRPARSPSQPALAQH